MVMTYCCQPGPKLNPSSGYLVKGQLIIKSWFAQEDNGLYGPITDSWSSTLIVDGVVVHENVGVRYNGCQGEK